MNDLTLIEPDPFKCIQCGYPADENDEWNGGYYCDACIEGESEVYRCSHCKGLHESEAEEPYLDREGNRYCHHCYQRVLHIHAVNALEIQYQEADE
jgi:hypothetical protein